MPRADFGLPQRSNPSVRRDAELARRCAAVLRGPDAGRFSFEYAGVRVDAAGLARVASALDSGEIGASERLPARFATELAGSGWKAAYVSDEDLLVWPPELDLASPEVRAVLLHEAIHALQDMSERFITYGEAEVMGMLGQVAYLTQFLEPEAFRARVREVAPVAADLVLASLDVIERLRIHEGVHATVTRADIDGVQAELVRMRYGGRTDFNLPFATDGLSCCRAPLRSMR